MRRLVRRPASLRGRVVVGVLALLTVLLVGLFLAVDLALSARLQSDLRTRLEDRAKLAEQLDGALQPQQLVDRLKGDGVAAVLCDGPSANDGAPRCVTPRVTPDKPQPGGRGPGPGGLAGGVGNPQQIPPAGRPAVETPPIQQAGSTLYVRTTLPESGSVLSLSVDSTPVTATVQRLILFEAIGGALSLLVAALLLGRVVSLALRPLDQMTTLAQNIASGDRGARLGMRRRDTELGRTATAFDAMLDELENALTAAAHAQAHLRQFLGDASHELRNPLAGLQTNAELLLRDEPDRTGRELAYVAMIRETRRASRLVDDLLTVARFDRAEDPPLAIEPTDLAEIAAQEAHRMRLRAPALDVVVDGDLHAPVTGDPQRLGQILANLLENARQATPAGSTVRISVTHLGDVCQLDVADTGPGVADDDRERIFERLVRLDSSRSRDTGGFGLGLPIARTLAEAHGGSLRCLHKDGWRTENGARFRLVLPARVVAAEPRKPFLVR